MTFIHPVSYIADIEAWTGTSVSTIRVGTHSFGTLPSDIPPSTSYLGCISDIGAIEQSIFQGSGLTGQPQISEGYIELSNTGRLDFMLNYGFDGRSFVVYRLDVSNLYSTRKTMFTGTLIGLDASNAWTNLRLLIRSRLREIDKPLLTTRYAGTTLGTGQGIEGNAEIKDQIKPQIFGSVRNITPKAVNPFDLIYQVCDNAVTFINVKVGGQFVSSAGDALTFEALAAATVPSGSYMTCLSRGLFKMGDSPAAVLTADVTQAVNSVPTIAGGILITSGVTNLNIASFTDANAFNDAHGGIYIDTDETVLSIVSRVLDSIGCAIISDLQGQFSVVIIRDPAAMTPVAAFDINNIRTGSSLTLVSGQSQEGQGIPAYSIVVKYDINYTPMDLSQLAGILTDPEKTVLTEPNKTAATSDVTVKNAHPLAVELTKDTVLTDTADATDEATRLLNLFKVRRDRLNISLHDIDADNISMGDCVTLTLDRFGFGAGKKFLVVGRTDEFRTRSVVLSLWG